MAVIVMPKKLNERATFLYKANEELIIYYDGYGEQPTSRRVGIGEDISVYQRLPEDDYGNMVFLGDRTGWIDLSKTVPKTDNDSKVVVNTSGETTNIEEINIMFKVTDDETPAKISPTSESNIGSVVAKGTVFTSTGRCYQGGSTWYKYKSFWINGEHLIKTTQQDANAEKYEVSKLNTMEFKNSTTFDKPNAITVNTTMNKRKSPDDASSSIADQTIKKGDVVSVSGSYTDSSGNLWYYLADGSGWISGTFNGVTIGTNLGECSEDGKKALNSRKIIADSLSFRTSPVNTGDAAKENIMGSFTKGDIIGLTGETKETVVTINGKEYKQYWEQCHGKDENGQPQTGWILSYQEELDKEGNPTNNITEYATSDLKAVNIPANLYKANKMIPAYTDPEDENSAVFVIMAGDDFSLSNEKKTINGVTWYRTTSGAWIKMDEENATVYSEEMLREKMDKVSDEDLDKISVLEQLEVTLNDTNGDYEYLHHLRVKDLYGVFGIPYQFLRITDIRTTGKDTNDESETLEYKEDGSAFGRIYTQKIVAKIPLLLIKPGVPSFMGDSNNKARREGLAEWIAEMVSQDAATKFSQRESRFYTIKHSWADFWGYVNPMIRAGAFFLGIADNTLDYDGTHVPYSKMRFQDFYSKKASHWMASFQTGFTGLTEDGAEVGDYVENLAFYVQPDVVFNESWANSTQLPSVADQINGLSQQAREVNYILGNLNAQAGGQFDALLQSLGVGAEGDIGSSNIADAVTNLLSGSFLKGSALGGIIDAAGKTASALIQGSKMIFPELWSDSTYGQEFTVNFKLSTPDGDKESWFMNIWIPMCVCIALVAPRTLSSMNAFHAPFIITANLKNMFDVPMGIVTSLSFAKGGEGAWTIDGLPTVVEVSMTIKDLYQAFAITSIFTEVSDVSGGGMFRNIFESAFLNNTSLMNWISTSCGVSTMHADIERDFEMYQHFITNKVEDNIVDKVTKIPQTTLTNIGKGLASVVWGLFKRR